MKGLERMAKQWRRSAEDYERAAIRPGATQEARTRYEAKADVLREVAAEIEAWDPD